MLEPDGADGFTGWCALLCDDGEPCPKDMTCVTDSFVDGWTGNTITNEYCA